MRSKKRKILFLIPSLVGGGAERTLINLLTKVDYSVYSINLLVVLKKGVYINQIPSSVQVKYLYKNENFVRALAYIQKKIGFTWLFSRRMNRIVTTQFDVAISFIDGNFTDLLFFSDKFEKRISWVHGSYVSNVNFARFYNSKSYVRRLITNRYRKLDGIYFVSNDSKLEFIKVFGHFNNMDVIYNVINTTKLLEVTKDIKKVDNTVFTFVAIGSLLPVKGYDLLIDSAKLVKKSGIDFVIRIAGSGPQEKYLKGLVNKYNLEEYVKFEGFLSNPYALLKSADVFVMSSVSEALPTVLCEAMILGIPTLVTETSGCREVVGFGEYGVMSQRTAEGLAKGMLRFMEEPNLLIEYQRKSLERAAIFADEEVVNQYYKVFNW